MSAGIAQASRRSAGVVRLRKNWNRASETGSGSNLIPPVETNGSFLKVALANHELAAAAHAGVGKILHQQRQTVGRKVCRTSVKTRTS